MTERIRIGRALATVGTALLVVLAAAGLAVALELAVQHEFEGDDDIPGAPLPASPFRSSLTETTTVGSEDWDDVYAIRLGPNESLAMTMTLDDPEKDDDFDLIVFPPGTKAPVSVAYDALKMVAASENGPGVTETVRYVPVRGQEGTTYVHVYCFFADRDDDQGGYGEYTLSWETTRLPTPLVTSRASRSVVTYGTGASVSGTATLAGAALQNVTVDLMARPRGVSRWTRVAGGKTGASGRYWVGVPPPTRTTEYHVRTRWGTTAEGTDVGYGYGPAFTVRPRAYLTFSSVPQTAYRNRTFTVRGVIKPSHTTSSRHVKLYVQRWNGSRWVPVTSKWMRSSGTSFSGKLALSKRGKWRVQARVGEDALHASKNSTWRTIRVR